MTGLTNPRACCLMWVSRMPSKGIVLYGAGVLLAKIDVKNAYRNIPIHPDDRWLMELRWEGSLFIDTALPFGLRSAPKIFTAEADAVEESAQFIIHYLNDFLVMGPPASTDCAAARSKLLSIFDRLSLPVAEEKLEGTITVLDFLGFTLDTTTFEVRLSATKLAELQVLRATSRRRSIPLDLLELLVGRQLDWTSPAWSQLFARSFLRETPCQPERTTSQQPGATSPSATNSVSIPHSQSQRRVLWPLWLSSTGRGSQAVR